MKRIFIALTIIFIFAGCNNNTNEKIDYEQTKQMMIDVLQTDEGKKVLQEVLSDEKMKQHLVMEADVVKESISTALLSKEATDMWQRLFQDPQFVESFQKSIAEEQKKLLKTIMHDADFQNEFLELLKDPEMTKQTITALKSQEYRKYLEETIQQSLENPLFLAKIEKTLLEAAEKKSKDEQNQSSSGQKNESE